tara:strand:+ start:1726 stop:1890 length:165 start_codon:yes stop_codon:yes gene_type:complete
MTAVQMALFGLFIILGLASMVMSADVASYGKEGIALPLRNDGCDVGGVWGILDG